MPQALTEQLSREQQISALEKVLDRIEGLLPIPDGQYRKKYIQVSLGAQAFSCLVYEATAQVCARGVPMESGDWMA